MALPSLELKSVSKKIDDNDKINWLMRVGNGEHFISSSSGNIWGINSKNRCGKHFIKNVKKGDRLWFIKSKSMGLVIGLAIFDKLIKREIGELISLTPSDEELGWTKVKGDWDYEVHYTDLINLTDCKLLTELKCMSSISKFNNKTCKVDLSSEFDSIQKYLKIKKSFD